MKCKTNGRNTSYVLVEHRLLSEGYCQSPPGTDSCMLLVADISLRISELSQGTDLQRSRNTGNI